MDEQPTRERDLLDRHPGVRDLVATLPAFLAWRAALPTVTVDGETFHVVGGDQLKDPDQTTVEWINQFQPQLLNSPTAEQPNC